ncbi:tail fiber assembly protein [Salipiger bermudensis]|uniref:tail fiber assembly protein n=1 Tax=Salipiger bermudensis TaxID=344736 RepID=UPI00300AF107
MSSDAYVVYQASGDRVIVGWGYTPTGTVPAAGVGEDVAFPTEADFDAFLSELETSGYPYRYPETDGGAYFEAYWLSNDRIGFGYLSGGVPPAGEGSPAEEARERRNALLDDSDWTQLGDVDLTSASKSNFATYRQDLRDVPQQSGFPDSITWPTRPAEVKT